jgi:hypothetical protein
MFNEGGSKDQGIDYLISRSGFIGRKILKLARFLCRLQERLEAGKSSPPRGPHRNSFLLKAAGILEKSALLAFIYDVGGSLTRSDQHTLADLTGMGTKQAYRLTLFNALLFGFPTAAIYFILGEGAHWAGDVHSWAAIPSWAVGNASRLMGAASLAVDLFRAGDAAVNRRCRAPFGAFPVLINLPTYVKILSRRRHGKRSEDTVHRN